ALAEASAFEYGVRYVFERNRDLGQPFLETLARPQVERHSRPTPGINLGLERDECLCRGVGRYTGLIEITRDRLAVHGTRFVLRPHRFGLYIPVCYRSQSAQHLQLFIAHRVRVARSGRL